MYLISYFFETFVFGFVLAAMIGPISMLCIKKALDLGFTYGMAVGLGAAFASGIYGLIVAAGMTAISDFLLDNTFYIKLIGGLFLLYLAYKEFKSEKTSEINAPAGKGFMKLMSQTFFLAMANPLTIMAFLAMFTNIGDGHITFGSATMMVVGVFLGSIAWWVILCLIVIKMRHRLSAKFIYRIRIISAVVLSAFGLWSIYDLL